MRITSKILLYKVDPTSENKIKNVPASKSKLGVDPIS